MILSDKELRILNSVEFDTQKPMKVIAKETGYKEHTIRYTLHNLKRLGFIQETILINRLMAGYMQFGIYFSIRTEDKLNRKKIIQKFLGSSLVPWIVEMGGEYQYGASIYAKTIKNVMDFLNYISDEFGSIFFRKTINIQPKLMLYNHAHLYPEQTREWVKVEERPSVKLDKIDWKILFIVAEDASLSYDELSKKLNIPASTIKYRIRKLEKDGVILRHVYALDHTKINTQIFVLFVSVKSSEKALEEKFANFCIQNPHVIYLVGCIGGWDFEFGIEVKNNTDMTPLLEDLYQKFGNDIITIQVLPIFRYLKYSLSTFDNLPV